MTTFLQMLAASGAVLAEAATQPQAGGAGNYAQRFVISVVSAGICILFIWTLRRIIHRRKLLLAHVPGRPNGLTALHVLGLVVFWLALEIAARQIALSVGDDQASRCRAAIVTRLIACAILLAASLLLAHVVFRHGIRRGMGLSLRHWLLDSVRGILALLAVYPVCRLLMYVGELIVPSGMQTVHPMIVFLRDEQTGAFWIAMTIILVVLIGPVAEEVLFRGIIQSALRHYLPHPWAAIAFTSVFFAIAHSELYQSWGALFALSIALGYNYERCGRLWPSILIHAGFNLINTVSALLESQ